MIKGCGDFSPPPESVTLHTCDPIGIGGASAHNTRDFFVQGASFWLPCDCVVEVIQADLAPAHCSFSGGKSCLMCGVIDGQQKVSFGQVLRVHKAVGVRDTRFDPLGVFSDVLTV